MNHPNRGYGFSSYNKNRFRKGKNIIILLVVIIVIALVVLYIALSKSEEKKLPSLQYLYENFLFQDVIDRSEELLSKKPLDFETLLYTGLSYYYLGESEYSPENRIPLFEKSIINLRRAALVSSQQKGKIQYIIGEAYYFLGYYYHDLSLEYLLSSIESGYYGENINEVLGMVYCSLKLYDNALEYFYKALDEKSCDSLYNVTAEAHLLNGDYDKAKEYYLHIIETTENAELKLTTEFQLGVVYYEEKQYESALQQFDKVIEQDRNYADSHYYKGNIYEKLAESAEDSAEQNKYTIMARAEWREVIKIDPLHILATEKLSGS